MIEENIVDIIDIRSYPGVEDILEKCYVKGKNLYILLKNTIKNPIIATIKDNYTSFRNELKRLLKEKRVQDNDSTKILNIIDSSHEIIYKENNIVINESKNL